MLMARNCKACVTTNQKIQAEEIQKIQRNFDLSAYISNLQALMSKEDLQNYSQRFRELINSGQFFNSRINVLFGSLLITSPSLAGSRKRR